MVGIFTFEKRIRLTSPKCWELWVCVAWIPWLRHGVFVNQGQDFVFQSKNLCVAQTSLEIVVLLPQPSKSWDYKYEPPYLEELGFIPWKYLQRHGLSFFLRVGALSIALQSLRPHPVDSWLSERIIQHILIIPLECHMFQHSIITLSVH